MSTARNGPAAPQVCRQASRAERSSGITQGIRMPAGSRQVSPFT